MEVPRRCTRVTAQATPLSISYITKHHQVTAYYSAHSHFSKGPPITFQLTSLPKELLTQANFFYLPIQGITLVVNYDQRTDLV